MLENTLLSGRLTSYQRDRSCHIQIYAFSSFTIIMLHLPVLFQRRTRDYIELRKPKPLFRISPFADCLGSQPQECDENNGEGRDEMGILGCKSSH